MSYADYAAVFRSVGEVYFANFATSFHSETYKDFSDFSDHFRSVKLVISSISSMNSTVYAKDFTGFTAYFHSRWVG